MKRAVGGVLFTIFILRSSAHALVLCIPKKGEGAVQAREQCKKNETELDPATAGLPLPLVVYDANENIVGTVISGGLTAVQVGMRAGGYSFALNAYREYLASAYPYELFFETENCSGTPFIQFPGAGTFLMPLVAVGGQNRTVYIADSSPPQSILARSEWLNPPSTDYPGRCNPTNTMVDVLSASPLLDLGTLFTPLFNVR